MKRERSSKGGKGEDREATEKIWSMKARKSEHKYKKNLFKIVVYIEKMM